MGFVRDRRQRVTAEFLRNNHSGADLFRTGGRSCANASAGSFRMAGAGCPDIERHGIMDTAEYTFTVGRVYLFSSDMPSCPAELALWGCFAYRAAGRPVLEAATRNGWDYLCQFPLPDAYRFCRPASRREHVWFMRCYTAARERSRFPNTFPSELLPDWE